MSYFRAAFPTHICNVSSHSSSVDLSSRIFFLQLCLALLFSLPLNINAFELTFDDPKLSGSIDSILSAGAAVRTTSPKHGSPGSPTSPSGNWSVFNDAGDLYSAPLTLITDIGITRERYGFFTRFGYVYDVELTDGQNECTNCFGSTAASNLDGISKSAKAEYNKFTLYDIFVYGKWVLGDHFTTVRIGKQVVNWGESNIMGGGINQMQNPIDLAKATTPGSGVKEQLLPQELIYGALNLTENTSAEAYYVWQWRRTEFIPVGSFFSPFDFIGEGFNPNLILPTIGFAGGDKPEDGGQWGLALHHTLEHLGDMDIGVYWVRSHAFQPYLITQATSDPGALFGLNYIERWSEDQDTYAISANGEIPGGGSFATEINLKPNFFDTRQCRNLFGLAGTPAGGATFPGATNLASPQVSGCENESSNTWTWLGNITYSMGGGPFGANKQSYIIDVAAVWIEDLTFGDPTDRVNSGDIDPGSFKGVDQLDRPLTSFSWGYTLVAAFEYNNAFWDLNVKPVFVFAHDVEGYSPFNNSSIVEDERIVKLAMTFEYPPDSWSLELAHTFWVGSAGVWDDRDNVTAIFKYSY